MEAEPQPEVVPMESKLKHLEFIQGVINRMGSNSFRLKGWTVVLISALLVVIAREDAGELALIGLVPVLVFWGLDAYFLRQERLFRALYDHVRVLEPREIDFSMGTGSFKGSRLTWRSVFFSRTLIVFYIAIGVAVLAAALMIEPQEAIQNGT